MKTPDDIDDILEHTAFDGFWYRAEVRHYSVGDEYGEHAYTASRIEWTKLAVVKHTPKGVKLRWVHMSASLPEVYQHTDPGIWDVQVLGTAIRQHAVPTRELALRDALIRADRKVAGCKARLNQAEKDRRLVETEILKSLRTLAKDLA